MCTERLHHAAMAVIALLAAGCNDLNLDVDLATADIDIPRTCIVSHGMPVPGGGPSVAAVSGTFTINVGDALPLITLLPDDSTLSVEEVIILPVSGSPNLNGVSTATIDVGAKNMLVASYSRPVGNVARVFFVGSTNNVVPFLAAGKIELRFTMSGNPPQVGWTADITVCVHGSSHATLKP